MKTREALAEDWAQKGFSCDLWVDPPGQRWEDYVHEVDELLFVAEGKLEVEIEGSKKILNQGDEVLIAANSKHSVRNIGGTAARWYYGYIKS